MIAKTISDLPNTTYWMILTNDRSYDSYDTIKLSLHAEIVTDSDVLQSRVEELATKAWEFKIVEAKPIEVITTVKVQLA